MYSVVLVDDERIITQGLRRVVNWARSDCQVVGEARDAQEGLDVIRSLRPDILFTDIRMPGEDGLTMLAALKAEFPRMQVTVLTGYRDFDYARRALHLGVARFLLKPSRMNELDEAISFMTHQLAFPDGDEKEEENAGNFIVRKAQSYIAGNCERHLTLQEVADECFVSQWYLSKLLNGHLGASFYDVLNSERIEKAKKLMENPSLRFSDIAEKVGFSDAAHFSRVFKKLEGISASDWRNIHCLV